MAAHVLQPKEVTFRRLVKTSEPDVSIETALASQLCNFGLVIAVNFRDRILRMFELQGTLTVDQDNTWGPLKTALAPLNNLQMIVGIERRAARQYVFRIGINLNININTNAIILQQCSVFIEWRLMTAEFEFGGSLTFTVSSTAL